MSDEETEEVKCDKCSSDISFEDHQYFCDCCEEKYCQICYMTSSEGIKVPHEIKEEFQDHDFCVDCLNDKDSMDTYRD